MIRKKILLLALLGLIAAASSVSLMPGTVSSSTQHEPIYINGNSFTTANGVTGGTGTAADPYIIEGWDINASTAHGIRIQNTDAYFIIRSVNVHSGLKTSSLLKYSGIYLYDVHNGVVQNIVASNNSRGIFVGSSTRVMVWGGSASANEYGIYVFSSSQITVAGWNVMSSSKDGIRVYTSFESIVTGSNFTSNQEIGINIYNSPNVNVSLNRVEANSIAGISLSDTTEDVVYHNSIIGNVEQAYDNQPLQNTWDTGYPSGGNYWSEYSGPDNCSSALQNVCTGPDGIGDQAFNVTSDLQDQSQDRYPLMASFRDMVGPTWTASSLIASGVGAYQMTLAWTEAMDDHLVAGYRVFQNGVLIATLPSTMRSLTVTGLTPLTSYTFKVEAGDESNNWSQDGPTVNVQTSSPGGGGGGRFFRT